MTNYIEDIIVYGSVGGLCFLFVAGVVVGITLVRRIRRVEEVTRRAELENTLALGLLAAELAGRGEADELLIRRATDGLRNALKHDPLERMATIILARIARLTGKNDEAIKILSDAIDRKAAEGQTNDVDYADFLYNRACYSAVVSDVSEKGNEFRDKALRDLAQSVKIAPANAKSARTDGDFHALRDDQQFQKIVGLANP